MARKTRLENIFIDNNRPGLVKANNLNVTQLPTGSKFHPNIDEVPLDEIIPHRENDDLFKEDHETPDRWNSFLDDIMQNGIHDPIIVRQTDMTILTGHRRYKAASELGLKTIPVRYLLGNISDLDSVKFMVRDNAQRRHWSSQTWIQIYRKIYPDFDKQILKENRGGDRKSLNKIKTDMSDLIEKNPNITAKRVALETGQKEKTVEKQLERIRKKIRNKNQNQIGDLSNKKGINTKVIKSIEKSCSNLKQKIISENPETRKEALKILMKITKEIKSNFK